MAWNRSLIRSPRALPARILFLTLTLGIPPANGAVAAKLPAWSVRYQPPKPVNGSPILLQVKPPVPLKALSGKWQSHEVSFAFDASHNTWYGIAGASLQTLPGTYPLTLEGATARGDKVSFQQRIAIGRGRYPTISVKVETRFTEPNPQQQQQIKHDQAIKEEAFKHLEPQQEWSGRFLPPVEARVSDIFGTRRVFNGRVLSMHQGLDYAVPSGTTVAALNRGTVLLAQPLYFEGNLVVLDHGQGLLSLYLHLSEFKVKEGEQVERGQPIGVSGGTGRATGPHLHVAVRWQGIYLDPATLLKLPLP